MVPLNHCSLNLGFFKGTLVWGKYSGPTKYLVVPTPSWTPIICIAGTNPIYSPPNANSLSRDHYSTSIDEEAMAKKGEHVSVSFL